MTKLVILGALVAVAACGVDDNTQVLSSLKVPAKPASGYQALTPIFHGMKPGSDNEICTWTDVITDRDVDVRSTQAFQSEPGGHHTVLFYTTLQQPPGTQRVCLDSDMASFRLVAASAAGGALTQPPGNLVYRIPKGAQLVINHHYLNTTDQTIDGQAVINVNFADPGGTYIRSGAVAFTDTSLAVQPGLYDQTINCTMNRAMKLWYLIPHMHKWGVNTTIDVTQAGTTTRMFDTAWNDSYTFFPPVKMFDLASPFVLSPGDQVTVACHWNNDTGGVLNFGFEMCVGFGQFVDDQQIGSWACDAGNWLPL